MKTITLINEKGGVGKTTLAVHLAAGLAAHGQRVLLVDADAQGHSTRMLRVKELGGLYRLLIQEAEWREVLRAPEEASWKASGEWRGGLWLLPSNVETRLIPMATDDIALLLERLAEMAPMIDVVVIDTAPTPSLLHAMIYAATDYAIIPTTCEDLALDGVAKSVKRLTQHNEARSRGSLPPLELLGIQPTLFDARTNAHLYGLDRLEERFGALVQFPIANRTVWRDAAYERRTVFAHAPTSAAAQEMWKLVQRVESAVIGEPGYVA